MITAIESVPVRKSITVNASIIDAFDVFTAEMHTWWPATHHIGATPMTTIIVEEHIGGRCYTRHEDGSEAVWARVLAYEPPTRLVLAWQITHEFRHQPDVSRASEVEVRFTSLSDDWTRVDLEHRLLERHGAGAEAMRTIVEAPNGWTKILDQFSQRMAQRTR